MRNIVFGSVLSLAVLLGGPALAQQSRPAPMVLSTTAFADGGQIPLEFTQAGASTSPELKWTNVPAGTQSFVLHVHDLDVSRDKTTDDQLHWLVWNIPGRATGLPADVPQGSPMSDGSLQLSASGPGYRGPGAPANGPMHHYTFELCALDTTLSLQPGADPFATRKAVIEAMQGHILGKAVYVGLFHRPQ